MEFNYLMKTCDGRQIAATFRNPVSTGDQIYYGTENGIEQFMVFEVKHSVNGGSTIVCDKM